MRKQEGHKTLGSFKYLGIVAPAALSAQTECSICFDAAGKRRVRNVCAGEIHRAYLR